MKSQKQFGVWMDSHSASVVGNDGAETPFLILAHVKGETSSSNSSEKNGNQHEKTVQTKFFKEIASHMVNATDIHVTGTGQAQEQFIHYLETIPQFKTSKTKESTSSKMNDGKLIEFFSDKF